MEDSRNGRATDRQEVPLPTHLLFSSGTQSALFLPEGGSIGRKYSKRSQQLTFSWLLGKYTAGFGSCVRLCVARCMATCHVRVSCNTTRSFGSSRSSRVHGQRKLSMVGRPTFGDFIDGPETPAKHTAPPPSTVQDPLHRD